MSNKNHLKHPARGPVLRALLLSLLTLALIAPSGVTFGADQGRYQLGPGDLIQIQVYGEDDLSIKARIETDGYLSYPLLGKIEVAGKTTDQLQQEITQGLQKDYLDDPDVRVFILEYRPVYVSGEVKNPGGYPYAPGLTVLKAVTLAGGFTDLASKSKIYLIPGDEANGRRRHVKLNASVDAGDIIIVEEGFF